MQCSACLKVTTRRWISSTCLGIKISSTRKTVCKYRCLTTFTRNWAIISSLRQSRHCSKSALVRRFQYWLRSFLPKNSTVLKNIWCSSWASFWSTRYKHSSFLTCYTMSLWHQFCQMTMKFQFIPLMRFWQLWNFLIWKTTQKKYAALYMHLWTFVLISQETRWMILSHAKTHK